MTAEEPQHTSFSAKPLKLCIYLAFSRKCSQEYFKNSNKKNKMIKVIQEGRMLQP